jgi:hypothetical protein
VYGLISFTAVLNGATGELNLMRIDPCHFHQRPSPLTELEPEQQRKAWGIATRVTEVDCATTASYSPAFDRITMAAPKFFISPERYAKAKFQLPRSVQKTPVSHSSYHHPRTLR